jgi:hypothetical protein
MLFAKVLDWSYPYLLIDARRRGMLVIIRCSGFRLKLDMEDDSSSVQNEKTSRLFSSFRANIKEFCGLTSLALYLKTLKRVFTPWFERKLFEQEHLS